MDPLDNAVFAKRISEWSTEYIRGQLALGPIAFASPEHRDILAAELQRRETAQPPDGGTAETPREPTAPILNRAAASAYAFDMIVGGCTLTAGILVSVASYLTTAPGGTFIIATGLIAGGLIQLVVSFRRRAKALYVSRSSARMTRH